MNTEREYQDRVERTSRLAAKRKLDGVLVAPGANLRYLFGFHTKTFERLTIAATNMRGESALVVPRLDEAKAKEYAKGAAVYSFTDDEGPKRTLRQCLTRLGLSRAAVGVEGTTPLWVLELLREVAPLLRLRNASSLFAALRIVKQTAEIEQIRRASAILEKGIAAGFEYMSPGRTEREVAFAIEQKLARSGAEDVPFCAVQSGPNSAMPHFERSTKKIARGELVVVDVGSTFAGYHADITRTFCVGQPSGLQQRVFDHVFAAQQAAIDSVQPGQVAEEIDRVARQVIAQAGFGEYFIHRAGHGLGLEVHEEPYIRAGSKTALRAGMVFTVEPGIYLPGKFGVRIEDNLVVTQEGYENLTTLPKRLTDGSS